MSEIERAIDSTKNRIFYITEHAKGGKAAHCVKAENQTEIQSIILNALEKQIPFRPISRKPYEGKCKCGVVFIDRDTNYCGNCGQKLDWSEVGE